MTIFAPSYPPRAPMAARLALAALVVLGLVLIWLPARPPMVDIPQHAGTMVLLRDLLRHDSPWAGELRINLFTPYLVGYLLALPLVMIMPVVAALKTVLSLAYLGFVGACIGLRRELRAAPELDGYFVISFFGMTYVWGLFTFLVAAPVGLLFIWLAIRYARERRLGQGIALAVLGSALLFCHALVFALAAAVGGLILIARSKSIRHFLAGLWPYLVLGAACLFYIFVERQNGNEDPVVSIGWGEPAWRIKTFLSGSFDAHGSIFILALAAIFAVLPFLMGLRIDLRRRETLVFGAVILVIFAAVPLNIWFTGLVYERFGLFVLPAYALMFSRPAQTRPKHGWVHAGLWSAVLLSSGVVLADHLVRTVAFMRESRDFEAVLAALPPGQRALGMTFDRGSKAAQLPDVYMHFPLWYEVDKKGFVESNFASVHTEVVRFQSKTAPSLDNSFAWDPTIFDWRKHEGAKFRYFFVRGQDQHWAERFKDAPCAPVEVLHNGSWRVLENKPCPSVP